MEIIIGSMFSGKSTELIRRISRLESIGKSVLVVNSSKDTRCDNEVQTHDKKTHYALKCDTLNEIIKNNLIDDYDIIAIDEAQFFSDLYETVYFLWRKGNKHFIICGLDGDFKQEKFGQILDLIPLATKVDKLYGYCTLCNNTTEGTYTIRKNSSIQNTEYIGGKEEYICVCYHHLIENDNDLMGNKLVTDEVIKKIIVPDVEYKPQCQVF